MRRLIGIPEAIVGFIREIIQEMKLVEFPSRAETFRKTGIVFGASLLLGLLLFGLDSLFFAIRNLITNITI
ncbi:MAG: Protein translocase subunit SecE [candidate division WS6 bacterium OLB20]|uniref:Protein translocase subunit SecE n=1 Tax=candidate division WS6 bacterium OLB20 TaxID=1617426 RepID=A0A136LYE1_9BACT|nr:MAG: Protein translocase subunit SecE [candidate division WS6 bacterium OLB20]